MSPAPTRLGVLGWPVRHSRSPRMQTTALRELGLDGWTYDLLPCPPEALAELLAGKPIFKGREYVLRGLSPHPCAESA